MPRKKTPIDDSARADQSAMVFLLRAMRAALSDSQATPVAPTTETALSAPVMDTWMREQDAAVDETYRTIQVDRKTKLNRLRAKEDRAARSLMKVIGEITEVEQGTSPSAERTVQ